jgi:hypothetical protein
VTVHVHADDVEVAREIGREVVEELGAEENGVDEDDRRAMAVARFVVVHWNAVDLDRGHARSFRGGVMQATGRA